MSRLEASAALPVCTRFYLTLRNDKPIPKKVEKLIYQEANSSCAFCGEVLALKEYAMFLSKPCALS
jgi:hypothetical protein